MKYLEICGMALLSLVLMGSACRKNGKQTHADDPMESTSLFGVWELKSIRRSGAETELPLRWNNSIYLALHENASAQWYRQGNQGLEYCEADLMDLTVLADQVLLNQYPFAAALKHDHLFLSNGFLPTSTVMLADFTAGLAANETVDLEWVRSTLDPAKAMPTHMFLALCEEKSRAQLPMEQTPEPIVIVPGPAEPTTSPAILEPKLPPIVEPTLPPGVEPTLPPAVEPTLPPGVEPTLPPAVEPTLPPAVEPTLPPAAEPAPVDDTDAVKITLPPRAYRVTQGKPLLFEHFDSSRDLAAISIIEMGRSEYLKIQSADDKNIIVEVDFLIPKVGINSLRIQAQMHSDTSGQFRPGRNIQIATQDPQEPVKILDQLVGSEPGLGNKDIYFSTMLRKNLSRYLITQGDKTLVRLIIELDYSALGRCRVLGVIPCWERPALFLDYVGIDLIQKPAE